MSINLSPEQEAQARQLAEELKKKAEDPFLAIARLLVATDESTLFGATEFTIRKEAQRLIGEAYSLHLDQKKTAIGARRSRVRNADKRPPITATESAVPKGLVE
jgi:hypothetical protein